MQEHVLHQRLVPGLRPLALLLNLLPPPPLRRHLSFQSLALHSAAAAAPAAATLLQLVQVLHKDDQHRQNHRPRPIKNQ